VANDFILIQFDRSDLRIHRSFALQLALHEAHVAGVEAAELHILDPFDDLLPIVPGLWEFYPCQGEMGAELPRSRSKPTFSIASSIEA